MLELKFHGNLYGISQVGTWSGISQITVCSRLLAFQGKLYTATHYDTGQDRAQYSVRGKMYPTAWRLQQPPNLQPTWASAG